MSELTYDEQAVAQAAEVLYEAQRTAQPAEPVKDIVGEGNVDAAYAVQELLMSRRESDGLARIGRKVGLTNPAVQAQLGVDQPDFGVLLSDMDVTGVEAVDMSRLISPRIEAEIAFVLARDVDAVDRASVVAAVGSARAAFEIVDSRVRDWRISIVDTIADNASSALFVLGDVELPLDGFDPVAIPMSLTADGAVVSSGSGAACMGDPVNALVWVAETAARVGRPLRAGEVVLSGALGPMVPFTAGTSYTADLGILGTVTAVAGR
ncbi:2-keto-4-pentenoate hydratase [Salinibacterium sp. ZJ70]|uniref:2-keto-4-pentenoate hydratase n=1 Tax=Salinibacterium sp. ZJ70 TaxID=2708084 RepID=UPI001423CAD1|nr:fumarylacetoacetate hydrolase family protein [Salinibacterium sp. ZJ70]